MSKNTKTLLAVAGVAAVGYYIWNQNKSKKASFANAAGGKLSPVPYSATSAYANKMQQQLRGQF